MMRDFFNFPVNRDFFGDVLEGFKDLPDYNYTKMRADIIEEDKNYKIVLDIPGFTKEEVSIKVEDDILTVVANKETNTEDETKYLRKERISSTIKRQFRFANIDKNNITASFVDGVLTLTIPKMEEVKNVINIKIE